MNLRKTTIIIAIVLICLQLGGCQKSEKESAVSSIVSSGETMSEAIGKFQIQNIKGAELNEENNTMPKEAHLYSKSEDAYKNPLKIKDIDKQNDTTLNLSIVTDDLANPKNLDTPWFYYCYTIVVERNYKYLQKEYSNKTGNIDTFTIDLENNNLKVENHILEIAYQRRIKNDNGGIPDYETTKYYTCIRIERAS